MPKSRKIVFIMTDTQRWDMVNCYRETGLKTPNLDRLAADGIRYERAYTTQPVCQPARAGIFTGQYPHSVGSWTNSYGISDTAKTVGQRLSKEGVHTAYIGKFHLDGGDYFGLGRCPDGWDPDYWYDMKNFLDELTEEERYDSRKSALMWERDFPETFTYGHKCTDKAIDFLKNYNDEDFFLVLSYDEPHDPSICPPPYSTMYKDYEFPISENVYDDMHDKPEHHKVWGRRVMESDKTNLKLKAPFLFGCNSYVDYEIGRVMDAVEQYAEDAIVIYTSDHGDMLCSHNLGGKGPAAYDEITRIPLIIKGKDVPRGVVDPHPVSHINLTPTILDMMDAAMPPVLEGKSILREIDDPSVRVNDYIFLEFGRYEVDHDGFGGFQPLRTVFDGRYKLTVNLLTSDELYDVQTDPGEMNNLIASEAHGEIRDRLHDVLLNHMNETRDPFRGYYWERRPWRKDATEASWDYTLMTRQRDEDPYFEDRQLDYGTGLPIEKATRLKG
ncbi:sulfatase-like hydrolase/transferase [Ruminococcaceae bacterium OttesenSCG-928-L11]|nr:sulfatase-like hydrolase/transferase [Ruminococcaceae bacterium OttesenSCG-928-L11]